ncbi:hypothetical protein BGZ70_001856 [Mortierella alpina]|uniref:Uncharacterized protein n=1 Tax=Mortierella alpina TaxID=64518 RepID=A0A9P6JEX3_MORAP|nr:hypothetical protein BGZ70_001856 [Mortierella alpina]
MDPQDPSLGYGHGFIQTTSNTLEPAPEVLLTRGCDKRSFAALEPEFVDSNDINGMAPASAVLQSDHLVIDDDHNLDEKFDMSGRVILTTAPSDATQPPVPKRTRLSQDDVRPTASDFAQLQPIIQPDSKREPGDQHVHHHRHTHAPREPPATSHSLSRRRSIADLVPPSSHRAPVNVDEPEAMVAYGEPMDSSSAALTLDDSEEEDQPPPALTAQYPGSKGTAASGSSSEPALKDQHQDSEHRFNPMRRPSGPSSGSSGSSSRQNSISQDPRHSASSKTNSTLFMPASHSSGPLDQRRNSTTSLRKAPQRPVRIQILDEAESEKIMEKSRHDASSNEELFLSQQSNQTPHQDPYRTLAVDDSDADIALPKEDPVIHDWDEEELEDEESGTSTPTATTGTSTPQFLTSHSYNSNMNDQVPVSTQVEQQQKRNDDEDPDDDDRDILCDPEREISVMSETQEADLHNMHVRLENQREFQDAAGLDLGEDDAQALNEDGQYGGAIEDDDEGDDYWENR